MKGLLRKLLEQGPPPEWNCPPPVEGRPAADRLALIKD